VTPLEQLLAQGPPAGGGTSQPIGVPPDYTAIGTRRREVRRCGRVVPYAAD
jgi:hypothetical protein